MAERKLIELLIDESGDAFGVEAISLVKFPAIEENFVFFSKDKKQKALSLAAIDEDKRTLIGAALIPDKNIPRYDEFNDEEYDVYFSPETVKLASELFLKSNRTNEHTFEHQEKVDGVSVVESWIVEDTEMDKSNLYNLGLPKGTWAVRVHVANDEMWDAVKEGEVRGFSIEGYFIDSVVNMKREEFESFSDYPEAASNNAQRALDWAEENGWGSCGTDVGKQRANQLANREPISMETVKRTYSYLSRAAEDADVAYGEGCGGLMYDAWGGKTMLNWAEGKVNAAKEDMSVEEDYVDLKAPCWDGYEQIGTKMKDGKEVPNCVPIQASKKGLGKRIYDAVLSLVGKHNFYAEVQLENGQVLATEDDAVNLGASVFTLDEEGMPTALDSGKYKTMAGVELEVFEGVVIEYDGQVQAIEEKTEEPEEMPKEVELDTMKVEYYKTLMRNKYKKKYAKKHEMARIEGQVIVYTANVDRIEALIADTSLDYDMYQDGNDVIVDIYYTFGFMNRELDEFYDALMAFNYDFEYIEL